MYLHWGMVENDVGNLVHKCAALTRARLGRVQNDYYSIVIFHGHAGPAFMVLN